MSDDRQIYRMPESRVVEIVTRVIDRREAEQDAKTKLLIEETVKQTLLQMGLDIRDPVKLQRNFAHLNEWTDRYNSVGRTVLVVVTTLIAGGTLTLIGQAIFGMAGAK